MCISGLIIHLCMREEIKKTFFVHTSNLSSTERSVPALLHLICAEAKQRKGCNVGDD